MGTQLNSMSSADRRDKKATDIKHILNDWDIRGGCFQEVGIIGQRLTTTGTCPIGFTLRIVRYALTQLITSIIHDLGIKNIYILHYLRMTAYEDTHNFGLKLSFFFLSQDDWI